jgi:hypothetical protein
MLPEEKLVLDTRFHANEVVEGVSDLSKEKRSTQTSSTDNVPETAHPLYDGRQKIPLCKYNDLRQLCVAQTE